MTETTQDKFRWIIEAEYNRQLLLARARVARAQAEVDDLEQRFAKFKDDFNDES